MSREADLCMHSSILWDNDKIEAGAKFHAGGG